MRLVTTRNLRCLPSILILPLPLSLAALLSACGGGDDAPPGSTLLVSSAEAPGVHCTTGGIRIDAGADANRNGVLDAGEVADTQYACNGVAGGNGATLVQMFDAPAVFGDGCTAGRKTINVGIDINANGVLDASEVTSSGQICGGSGDPKGQSRLMRIVSEPAGPNCVQGGRKAISWLDSSANNAPDAGESGTTQYFCDWVNVSGAAVQALPNGSYVASNDAGQVVVTLPDSATLVVGDVVRVSGAGLGGWKIAQGVGQTVSTASLGGMAGAVWTAHEASRQWWTVASSSDGDKLVAVDNQGLVYTSSDSGANWAPGSGPQAAPASGWQAVASSADGSKLAAAAWGGRIYTSADSGVSWAQSISGGWNALASSADGSKLVAAAWVGQIYTSIDSGANWTARESGRTWASVASSAEGDKLVAAAYNGKLYTSVDSGVNWTARDFNRPWWSVASSANGDRLVAVIKGGTIFTSTDSGVNWVQSSGPNAAPTANWQSVASSADGSKLIAVVASGQIYTSNDSGANWTVRESNRNWYAVALSADGGKSVAVERGGRIYTSVATTTPGTGGAIGGGSADTIELRYAGNGAFDILNHTGKLTFQ